MRRIDVSDDVWTEIARRGKFGETEDDVLRREFGLPPRDAPRAKIGTRIGRGSTRYATKRMSARIQQGQLIVEFEDSARQSWLLPERTDKEAIGQLRKAAVEFALANGASDPGQTNAVRKALTDNGYHITRPRTSS